MNISRTHYIPVAIGAALAAAAPGAAAPVGVGPDAGAVAAQDPQSGTVSAVLPAIGTPVSRPATPEELDAARGGSLKVVATFVRGKITKVVTKVCNSPSHCARELAKMVAANEGYRLARDAVVNTNNQAKALICRWTGFQCD